MIFNQGLFFEFSFLMIVNNKHDQNHHDGTSDNDIIVAWWAERFKVSVNDPPLNHESQDNSHGIIKEMNDYRNP